MHDFTNPTLRNKFTNYPALIGGIEQHLISKKRVLGQRSLWKGQYDCGFWTPHSMFHYPYLLTSAYYSGKIPNWRRNRLVGDSVSVMGDSGGFQAATLGADIDPVKILRWQEANCNIGFTLDLPPAIVKANYAGPVRSLNVYWVDDKEFDRCLDVTIRNNDIYAANRINKNLHIMNCTHGETDERFDKWINAVRHYPFEGWGGGVKPTSDPLVQAMGLCRFWRNGITDRIHLLGVGGKNVIPLICYATKYFTRLTADASSYGQGYLSKVYWHPTEIGRLISFGRNPEMFDEYDEESYNFGGASKVMKYEGLDKLPCECPICREIDHPDILAQRGSIGGALIALHNLYWLLSWIDSMLEMTYDELASYIENTSSKRCLQAVDFLETCMNQSYQKAINKYFDLLPSDMVGPRQFSLF